MTVGSVGFPSHLRSLRATMSQKSSLPQTAKSVSQVLMSDIGIVRLDHALERDPRHHRFHLAKEHVTLRALLLRRKVERREAQLVHGLHPLKSMALLCHARRVDQRFPNRAVSQLIDSPKPLGSVTQGSTADWRELRP